MNLTIFQFRLTQKIEDFKSKLIFLYPTYYSRWFVFKVIDIPFDKVLGFRVSNVELAYNGEDVVSMWYYTEENSFNDIIDVFTSHFGFAALKVKLNYYKDGHNGIQYYWQSNKLLVGIGIRENEENVFIYVSDKNNSLHLVEDSDNLFI